MIKLEAECDEDALFDIEKQLGVHDDVGQNEIRIKIPGITISPNPSMENCTPTGLFQIPCSSTAITPLGNTTLIGTSSPFATVTITSVPKTQNTS